MHDALLSGARTRPQRSRESERGCLNCGAAEARRRYFRRAWEERGIRKSEISGSRRVLNDNPAPHLMPRPCGNANDSAAVRASGVESSRWNAQLAGWMRRSRPWNATRWRRTGLTRPMLHRPRRGRRHADCNSVRRSSAVRTHSERFRIGGIITTHDSVLTAFRHTPLA